MNNIEDSYNFDSEFGIDVQKRFLTLLVYETRWAELTGLDLITPDKFENRTLQNLCKWIHEHYKEYKSFPTPTVLNDLATEYIRNNADLSQKDYYRYKDYIDDIFTLGEKESLEFFKDKAIDFSKQLAWKKAMEKAAKFLRCKRYNEAIKLFTNIVQIGSENDLGIDFSQVSVEDFIKSLNEEYDVKGMIRTGIAGWDAALGGGFVKNNLHIIGAAPGAGKSKLMSYLAKQALADMKRVVFITLELDEMETLTNICMATAAMSIAELRDPDNLDKAIEKIDDFKNMYCTELHIKFYKPSTVTANTIHNYIQKLIQVKRDKENRDWKPDVIFLDYMDKLLPVDKVKGNIYEDNGGVADDCKNLAIDFNCPVITGSQLGRGSWNLVGNEVISMSSIAESARKAHLAHSLTTINANPQEKELGKARLYLAKSRSGSTGKVVYLNHNLLRNKFSEAEEPWTQEQLSGATSFTVRDTNNSSKK